MSSTVPEEEKWSIGSMFAHNRQAITGSPQGAIQFVAAEVLVAWAFQRVTGWKDMTKLMYQNAIVHALSIPIIPGLRAQFDSKEYTGYAAEKNQDVIMQAVRQVPAYLLARYIYNTSHVGIRLPKFDKHLLSGVISKILTRPVIFNLLPYLPETIAEAFLVFEAISDKLKEDSRLREKPESSGGDARRRLLRY